MLYLTNGLRFKNKTAIVCGGTQGIGLGIAQEFAKARYKINNYCKKQGKT